MTWNSTIKDLENVTLPPKTATYNPVPYVELVQLLKYCIAQKLPAMKITEEKYLLTRKGKRMLGMLVLGEASTMGTRLFVGIRSSLDKSVSVAAATGERLDICSNMLLSGSDITYFRRQTGYVWNDLGEALMKSLEGAEERYKANLQIITNMQKTEITEKLGYRLLGELVGLSSIKILTFSDAMKQWKEPSFIDFKHRNLWSLYNALTYAMGKRVCPKEVFDQHRVVRTFIEGQIHPHLISPKGTSNV